MVNLIHISDLHYGSEFVPEYMENVIKYIEDESPDAVICTGDIIHKGRISQFKGILPYLKRIRECTRFLAVPGNHDVKNSGIIFFEKLIGPRRSRLIIDDNDTLIVGICTARDDIAHGECGDEQ